MSGSGDTSSFYRKHACIAVVSFSCTKSTDWLDGKHGRLNVLAYLECRVLCNLNSGVLSFLNYSCLWNSAGCQQHDDGAKMRGSAGERQRSSHAPQDC